MLNRCTFFIVPVGHQALLRMPGIELLGIIRVLGETMDNKTTGRKFGAHTQQVADCWNCRTNRDPQAKLNEDSKSADKINIPTYINSSTSISNMPGYLNSSNNKEADKRVSEAITNRNHNEFNDLFSGIGCFEDTVTHWKIQVFRFFRWMWCIRN